MAEVRWRSVEEALTALNMPDYKRKPLFKNSSEISDDAEDATAESGTDSHLQVTNRATVTPSQVRNFLNGSGTH